MQKLKLGNTDLTVSAIGSGCMGLREIASLEENKVTKVELSEGDLADINSALSQIKVQGDRYSPGRQKLVGR